MLTPHSFQEDYYVFITLNENQDCFSIYFGSSKSMLLILEKLAKKTPLVLVYYRHFFNHLDALGYKLLLQTLSKDTLWRIIDKGNPTHIDLYAELFNIFS